MLQTEAGELIKESVWEDWSNHSSGLDTGERESCLWKLIVQLILIVHVARTAYNFECNLIIMNVSSV